MRFEISNPGGTTHEVELAGSVCVMGRDPACDIVLNDSKCSRRHAVVEQGPDGLEIRDSGSANGIFVNGKRVERAALRPGDTVRLGEVKLRLLPELGETIVVASEAIDIDALQGGPFELGDSGAVPLPPPAAAEPTPAVARPAQPPVAPPAAPQPAPRPVAARPAARPRTAPSPREGRATPGRPHPATVSLLAILWALFVPLAVGGVLLTAARLSFGWMGWLAAAALATVCAGFGTAMALGLRALAAWARHLQIATAAVGLLVCPFTLAAATILLYMSRPEVKAAFGGDETVRPEADSAEPTFALSLVGMLLLGLALTAIVALVI